MSGIMMIGLGIGLVIFSMVLFVESIIYRQTVGRKIRKELMRDYE